MYKLGRLIAACALILAAFLIGNALSMGGASAANCGLKPCDVVPQGSCQPSSSLTVLVKGMPARRALGSSMSRAAASQTRWSRRRML
jgi:hypothetical protein